MTRVLITDIGHLTTNDGPPIRNAAIEMTDGRFTYIGTAQDAPFREDADLIDCGGRAVIPGFVDAHTHLVFAGDRSGELSMRLGGASYSEIAASGGGILTTVEATRKAPEAELFDLADMRVRRMIAGGTTAIEIKSGYGLDNETELRLLRIAREVGEANGIEVRVTFLGAHAVAPELQGDRSAYIDRVIEMMPAAAELADYCDVFVEDGAFTVEEGRAIFEEGARHGLRARVHAEQLSHSGGAMLAADIGAASADHLDHATPEDAEALAEAGVAAVLVPGASRMLRSPQAPGPMLWDAGCIVALATDCNPGTSFYESMTPIIGLAVIEMGLTVPQAIWAATRGGALALEMSDRGIIRSGSKGALVILDAPTPDHIVYRPATNLIYGVVRDG